MSPAQNAHNSTRINFVVHQLNEPGKRAANYRLISRLPPTERIFSNRKQKERGNIQPIGVFSVCPFAHLAEAILDPGCFLTSEEKARVSVSCQILILPLCFPEDQRESSICYWRKRKRRRRRLNTHIPNSMQQPVTPDLVIKAVLAHFFQKDGCN